MVRGSTAVLAVVLGCIWLTPSVAWACGLMVPKMQVVEYESEEEADDSLVHDAETMFYVDRGDGRWTVYQGRSIDADDAVEELVWLLPVPGIAEVEVAPTLVFERLAQATDPVFELEDESTGDCPAEVRSFVRETVEEELSARSPGAEREPQAVEHSASVRAVDAGSVGPYEHVTIETAEGLDDSAEKAVQWLEEHGYRVESVDLELLREYLDDGLNLLAMRLRADAGAEDVQPVAITVEMEGPISPMRLARAGAAGQTDILVWAAGQGRAFPHGWPRVEIDEGLVDWADGGTNYSEVVAAAVSEAGGLGFVTDYAMGTDETNGVMWSTEEQKKWEELRGRSDFEGTERKTLETVTQLVGGEELLTEMLREKMPLPGRGELGEVIELAEFSAKTNSVIEADPFGRNELFGRESRDASQRGADDLLEAFKDGGLLAGCFAREIQADAWLYGEWSGRFQSSSRGREIEVDNVRSTLSPSFNGCIAHALQEHLTEKGYNSDIFPVEVAFRFANPYEYLGEEVGFPALQASTYTGVDDVDWAAMVEQIDETIVQPLRSAQERLDATATLTRLSTAVEAKNLTKDVTFPLVPDHSEVPAKRHEERLIECGGQELTRDDRVYEVRDWSMEFERGEEVEGRGEGWPVSIGDREAARLIVEYDQWGQVVDERGDAVDGEVEYIEVDVEAMKAKSETEQEEAEVVDTAASEDAVAVKEDDGDEDTNSRRQWLLGALTAFTVISLALWALRRTEA